MRYLICTFLFGLSISAQPPAPPATPQPKIAPLIDCDFAQLDLQIDSVKAVNQVDSVNGHITALAGKKLVIVRLKAIGKAKSAFVPLVTLLDIEAVYRRANAKPNEIPYDIGVANGVLIAELIGGRAYWSFLNA